MPALSPAPTTDPALPLHPPPRDPPADVAESGPAMPRPYQQSHRRCQVQSTHSVASCRVVVCEFVSTHSSLRCCGTDLESFLATAKRAKIDVSKRLQQSLRAPLALAVEKAVSTLDAESISLKAVRRQAEVLLIEWHMRAHQHHMGRGRPDPAPMPQLLYLPACVSWCRTGEAGQVAHQRKGPHQGAGAAAAGCAGSLCSSSCQGTPTREEASCSLVTCTLQHEVCACMVCAAKHGLAKQLADWRRRCMCVCVRVFMYQQWHPYAWRHTHQRECSSRAGLPGKA